MEDLTFRLLSSILSGMVLSQTGSLIQMSTRNILASPSTLGFDGLSVLWVLIFHSVLLIFGHDQPLLLLFISGVPIFAVLGWLYSLFISGHKNIERLILIGLTFNLLVGAVFSLWQFLFLAFNLPFPVELWFGHFRFANGETFLVLIIVESIFLAGWVLLRREIHLFSLGRSIGINLKLNQKKLHLFMLISISLGTFTVVSLFGAFSFLGLIFPIMARKLWFRKFDLAGEFLIGSVVNGSCLMLIDSLCYFFPVYGAEVPVGLIATAVGALSLILLLWKSSTYLEILAKR